MSSNQLKPQDGPAQPARPAEPIRSRSEMLAAEASARADKRRAAMEELSSDLRSPEERVRSWQRFHGLTLPLDPNHPILDLIAADTHLTMQEVQAVQRSQAALRSPGVVSPKP